ncbi:hypothetical protein [Enterovibrio norvegicus]|uniref:hypothetical protein n=1 Tax=Enterovibrio norvegicus TaxID=188144 RepID=UPI0024B201D0|nr:hypothetical protein [Enterovibrio norvegicus]
MSSKKQTETKLPPLLPLEYCTVERAARLFGCEIEDIFHWQEIGAIDLCAKLDEVPCKAITLSTSVMPWGEEVSLSDIARFRMLNGDKLAFFSDRDWKSITSETEIVGPSFSSETSDLYGFGNAFVEDSGIFPLVYDASASGFWIDIWREDEQKVRLWKLGEMELDAREFGYKDVSLHSIEVAREYLDDKRYLMRKDLLSLHNAINGRQALPNRHNDAEVADKLNKVEGKAARPSYRQSNPQQNMIQELAKIVLKVEDLKNPHSLAESLLIAVPEFEENHPVDIRTVARWLGAK